MGTAKILLVDDVKLFIELEKSFLKHSAVQVLTASNGEEALEIVRRERPDLIFMDLNMPKMDGVTCCTAIKADPELLFIPVIMVTTAGREEEVALCRQAGCEDFLTKPVDRRLFLEKARRFLPDVERREPRIATETPVLFRLGPDTIATTIIDVSNGGIYLASELEVALHQEIELAFFIPGSNHGIISARGRVAWVNLPHERKKWLLPVGFGVEFTAIPEELHRRVKEWVSSPHPGT